MRRSVLILTIALLFVTCGLTAHTLPVVSSPGEQARFVVRHQTVNVEVYNHLVRTTVSQLVFNDGDEEMPCHFDLYLPRGAHASSLTAEVDGKKYVGRIETKQAAREIVEKSREQKKAAALAEERDGVLHVELSQVKAGQEFLFTVSYIQEAEYSDGAFNYYFGIQRFNKEMKLPDSFLMNLRMDCTTDIVSATSSTHTLVGGLNGTNASFEVEDIGIIEKDFHFAYMLHLKPGEPEVMMLDQANEDPYFCMLSLPPEAPAEAASRSLVVILDKSGSMRSGDKFNMATSALNSFVDRLRDNDQFNLFIFDSSYTYASPLPFRADAAGKDAAREFIKKFDAGGGTYILGPTMDALKQLELDKKNPTAIVLLTDGRGRTGAKQFILKVDAENSFSVPMFVFAIGQNVNIPLLRSLGRYSGGAFSLIKKGSDISGAVKTIGDRFDRINGFSLDLTTDNNAGYYRHPQRLSHVYEDEPIIVYGRLDDEKSVMLNVGANTTAGEWARSIDISTVGEKEDCPFLDQGWGIRRIQALLDDESIFGVQADRKRQIIRLSQRYLITTPHTSLVFSELAQETQKKIADDANKGFDKQGAVGGSLSGLADSPANAPSPDARRARKDSKKDMAPAREMLEKELKRKKPADWFNESNDILGYDEKPVADQVLAQAMTVLNAYGIKNDVWSARVKASAVWLGVHSQDGKISDDYLHQLIATNALLKAKDEKEGLDEIANAMLAHLKTLDVAKHIENATDEYVLLCAYYAWKLEGFDLPAILSKRAKKWYADKFGDIKVNVLPFGSSISEINKWVSAYPLALGLHELFGVRIDTASVKEYANVCQRANHSTVVSNPDVIYWLAWLEAAREFKGVELQPVRSKMVNDIRSGKDSVFTGLGSRMGEIMQNLY